MRDLPRAFVGRAPQGEVGCHGIGTGASDGAIKTRAGIARRLCRSRGLRFGSWFRRSNRRRRARRRLRCGRLGRCSALGSGGLDGGLRWWCKRWLCVRGVCLRVDRRAWRLRRRGRRWAPEHQPCGGRSQGRGKRQRQRSMPGRPRAHGKQLAGGRSVGGAVGVCHHRSCRTRVGVGVDLVCRAKVVGSGRHDPGRRPVLYHQLIWNLWQRYGRSVQLELCQRVAWGPGAHPRRLDRRWHQMRSWFQCVERHKAVTVLAGAPIAATGVGVEFGRDAGRLCGLSGILRCHGGQLLGRRGRGPTVNLVGEVGCQRDVGRPRAHP